MIKRDMDIDDLPSYLSISEVQTFLGVGRSLAYSSVSDGTIPSIRLGRRVLVPRTGLKGFLLGETSGMR